MKTKRIFRMTASVLLLVLAFSVFSFPTVKLEVSAAKVSDSKSKQMEKDIENIKKKQEEAKQKLDELKKNEASQYEIKAALEEEIKLKKEEIEKYKELCADLEARIAEKQQDIESKSAEWDDKFEKFKKRLVAAYEEKQQGYAAMLLSNGKLSEYYRNAEYFEILLENDKQVMDELNSDKETLIEEKTSLIDDMTKAEQYRNNLSAAQNDLENKIKEVNNIIYTIQQEEKKQEKNIDELQADLKARNAELEKYLKELAARGGTFTQGKLSWPLSKADSERYNWISSPFGPRTYLISGRWVTDDHYGVDICVPTGTPVYAAGDGTVVKAVYYGGSYGTYVLIDHGGGVATLYAHNSALTVREGQKVTRGQEIAISGATGNVSGPHLHFEYRINGKVVDPLQQNRVATPIPLKYV